MKKTILSGLCLAMILSAALAENLTIAAHKWKLLKDTDDMGTLVVNRSGLTIDFDAKVTKEYQFGHERIRQAAYSVYLDQPIPLKKDQTRIFFTAKGILQPYSRAEDSYNLFPVIRDQSGEEFYYTAYPETYLGQPAKWHIPVDNWQRWRTNYFYTNEAGGSTVDIYESIGGDGNDWPDGKLEFLGFKLFVRSKKENDLKGRVTVSEISFGGKIVAEQSPYLFASSIVKKKGRYTFAYQVRDEFQGTPVAEGSTTFDYDPDSVEKSCQKLVVPLGPADNYWIRYVVTDDDGKVVAVKSGRWQVENDLGAPMQPVDLKTAPSVGAMRVNPERHTTGVYEREDPFEAIVRVFAQKSSGDFILKWQLLDYNRGLDGKNYDTVLDTGEESAALKVGGSQDLLIKLDKKSGRDAYRLLLKLYHDEKLIDEIDYVLGIKTDFSEPLTDRIGKLPDRHEIKKSTYYHTTFHHPSYKLPHSLEEDLAGFEEYLRESKEMANNIDIMLDVRDLEVLPGVFDFHLLDRYLNLIADYGMKATITLRHYDANGEYLWEKYSRQRSFDNVAINQHYYGSFDLSDLRIADAWKRAANRIWRRYRKHPAFLGYYFLSVAGELSVIDKPWHGINVGHNKVSDQAFRDYLKQQLGLSLTDLNQRWGTQLTSWNQVTTPKPTYEKGVEPDLSMRWLDFCEFKHYQDQRFWYETIVHDVRKYDDKRVIICHNSRHIPVSNYGLQDYGHNGGNHWKQDEKALMAAWEKGTGQITEPHNPHHWGTYGDPEERGWVLDHSVYCMLAQGGGGCANLHTYWLNDPPELVNHYGASFAYDRVEKFKPILNELVRTRLIMKAPKIGVIQDLYTLFAKHRTTFTPRLQDLQRWLELLKTDGLQHAQMVLPNGEWSPDLNEFKLLVPNALDEVMSPKTIDKLNELVRAGARMVIPATVGRYCPNTGVDFAFLKKLGIHPPKGEFNLKGLDVKAKVDAANPIFKVGEEFAFYTTEQQKREAQGDIVKTMSKFWKWPYRWLPISNYFGYFSDNMDTNGKVIARFANGAVAMSLHKVGKGEVLVLWGTPDYKPEFYKGFMTQVAKWAGATATGDLNPMAHMFELSPMDGRKRHYAVIYEEQAGTYKQKIKNIPDGTYFVDDMVTDRRFGTYTAAEIRDEGIEVAIDDTSSPLRILRFIDTSNHITKNNWREKYRMPKTK